MQTTTEMTESPRAGPKGLGPNPNPNPNSP